MNVIHFTSQEWTERRQWPGGIKPIPFPRIAKWTLLPEFWEQEVKKDKTPLSLRNIACGTHQTGLQGRKIGCWRLMQGETGRRGKCPSMFKSFSCCQSLPHNCDLSRRTSQIVKTWGLVPLTIASRCYGLEKKKRTPSGPSLKVTLQWTYCNQLYIEHCANWAKSQGGGESDQARGDRI